MESPKLFQKNKKGQLVFNLVGGAAALIILVIVCFLIVDTLNSADLLSQTASTIVTNETLTKLNVTAGDYLSVSNYTGVVCSNVVLKNITSSIVIVAATNYTVNSTSTSSGCHIRGLNESAYIESNINVDYTYTWNGGQQDSIDGIIANYTNGVNNVSEKIPTVLLVAAVVLLFGAIVFLVQRARATTESTGGSL